MGARTETIRWLENSELGREIAVDLEADADFDESRGRPSHAFSSLRAPTGRHLMLIDLARSSNFCK